MPTLDELKAQKEALDAEVARLEADDAEAKAAAARPRNPANIMHDLLFAVCNKLGNDPKIEALLKEHRAATEPTAEAPEHDDIEPTSLVVTH
jgi:septal ring factor EnvC (AmiA/AmiB activator)